MLLQLSSNFQDLISTKYNVNLLLFINIWVFGKIGKSDADVCRCLGYEYMIMYKILYQLRVHDGMF